MLNDRGNDIIDQIIFRISIVERERERERLYVLGIDIREKEKDTNNKLV